MLVQNERMALTVNLKPLHNTTVFGQIMSVMVPQEENQRPVEFGAHQQLNLGNALCPLIVRTKTDM